jgi:hypothetical protein
MVENIPYALPPIDDGEEVFEFASAVNEKQKEEQLEQRLAYNPNFLVMSDNPVGNTPEETFNLIFKEEWFGSGGLREKSAELFSQICELAEFRPYSISGGPVSETIYSRAILYRAFATKSRAVLSRHQFTEVLIDYASEKNWSMPEADGFDEEKTKELTAHFDTLYQPLTTEQEFSDLQEIFEEVIYCVAEGGQFVSEFFQDLHDGTCPIGFTRALDALIETESIVSDVLELGLGSGSFHEYTAKLRDLAQDEDMMYLTPNDLAIYRTVFLEDATLEDKSPLAFVKHVQAFFSEEFKSSEPVKTWEVPRLINLARSSKE